MRNPKGYPYGVKNAENNERSVNAVQKLKEKPKKEETRKIAALVAKLNQYRHEYYNEAKPGVSDAVYDHLFDELQKLEKKTGIVLSNSPTQTVGYAPVSSLEKVRHPIPLLSLDKTKQTEELLQMVGKMPALLMMKLDGLTIKLVYENGQLVKVSTRGDGDIGFKDYLLYWFEEMYSQRIENTTRMVGAYTLYDLILPHIEQDIRLRFVNVEYLDSLLETAAKPTESAGNKCREFLNLALKDAVAQGYIKNNPVPGTRAYRRKKPNVTILSKEKLKTLLAAASQGKWYLEILLAVFCGLRKGEIGGLKYSDFDMEQNTLSVSRQLTSNPVIPKGQSRPEQYQIVEKPPKTENSYRTIRVPEVVIKELRIRKSQAEGDVQKLYNTKAEYSISVARMVKTVVNVSFRYALNHKFIASNQAEGIRLPGKVEKKPYHARNIDNQKTLTLNQIMILLEASRDTPIHMQVLFNVLMGLRRSEINGLKYSDVDYVNRTLTVQRQLGKKRKGRKGDFKPKTFTKQEIALKSESSYRELPIPDYVFEAILEERKKYEKHKNRRKKEFQDLDYICCSTYGRPRSKGYHFQHYKKLLADNGLPDIRWHDLRSTFCTLLLKNDFSPKAVSKLMGHAKEIITMDVYGDNKGIIEDCIPEIAGFIDEVLPEEQADETFRKELLEIVIDTSEYLGEAS